MAKKSITKDENCIAVAANNLERHQLGFDGEHVAKTRLKKMGYKGVKETSHTAPFDVITGRTAWEIKTCSAGAKDIKMTVKKAQKIRKLAWAKKYKKDIKSMLVVLNGGAEIYIKNGSGAFRPSNMKKISGYKDWRVEVGHGRVKKGYDQLKATGVPTQRFSTEKKWLASLTPEEQIAREMWEEGESALIRDVKRVLAGEKAYSASELEVFSFLKLRETTYLRAPLKVIGDNPQLYSRVVTPLP